MIELKVTSDGQGKIATNSKLECATIIEVIAAIKSLLIPISTSRMRAIIAQTAIEAAAMEEDKGDTETIAIDSAMYELMKQFKGEEDG